MVRRRSYAVQQKETLLLVAAVIYGKGSWEQLFILNVFPLNYYNYYVLFVFSCEQFTIVKIVHTENEIRLIRLNKISTIILKLQTTKIIGELIFLEGKRLERLRSAYARSTPATICNFRILAQNITSCGCVNMLEKCRRGLWPYQKPIKVVLCAYWVRT